MKRTKKIEIENISIPIEESSLRVWWIPRVPMKAFHVEVNTIKEAKLILKTLAEPDFSNAGGLQVFEDGEWLEWECPVCVEDIDNCECKN